MKKRLNRKGWPPFSKIRKKKCKTELLELFETPNGGLKE